MLFHFTAQVLAQPIIAQLPERAGWGTPVILALRRQRQEDLGFKSCNNEETICEGGGGESVGFPYAKETIALIGSIFPSHPPSLPLSLWCFLFYISHLFCWNKVAIYEQPKKLTVHSSTVHSHHGGLQYCRNWVKLATLCPQSRNTERRMWMLSLPSLVYTLEPPVQVCLEYCLPPQLTQPR